MIYTLGTLENALKQIKDRLDSHRVTGESLADIKSVLIGARPISDGTIQFPRIIINLVSFSEQTSTMAGSAGLKSGRLTVEFRLIAEKIKDPVSNKYADNVLSDAAGKGILAYLQWLCDALTETAADAYSPELSLALDTIPDARFNNIDEGSSTVELSVEYDFNIRYTVGQMGGVKS